MKKTILFFVFICWATAVSYAQTDLKKVFDENANAFDKDPVGWVQKLPENVRFFGGDGPIFNKQQTLELGKRSASSGKSTSSFSDLRVKQSGNLGVASGIRIHELVFANGMKMSWKDAFTYTFEWQNNQWVNTDLHHTKLDYQLGEEAAIKQTCENETKYFHAGDSKNWTAQWSDSGKEEYMAQDIVNYVQVPYMKSEKFKGVSKAVNATLKPDGKESKMTDFQARINGNLAWATYLQEDFKDGASVARAHQLRILEKQNGQWKIVALSIQKL